MHPDQQADNDAWFSRNDRFDGFDRGDLDRKDDHDRFEDGDEGANDPVELHALNERTPMDEDGKTYAEQKALFIKNIRDEIENLSALDMPRGSHVAYLAHDFTPYQYNPTRQQYGLCAGEDAYTLNRDQARRIAAYFTSKDMPSSSAPFASWRAARIDSLKDLADRLSK